MEKIKLPKYMGCKTIEIVRYGEWADPELKYKGYVIDYWDVEDTMWERFKEECAEQGLSDDDDAFHKYCQQHEDEIQDLIVSYGKKIVKESKTNKNMKKSTVKLNEAQLRKIVAESVKKVLNEMGGISSSPVQTKMGWQQAFEEGVQLGKQFIESQGTSDARMAYEKNRREFWKLKDSIFKKYRRDGVSLRACIDGLHFSMGMGNVDTRKYQGFHGRDYLNLGGAYGADNPIM